MIHRNYLISLVVLPIATLLGSYNNKSRRRKRFFWYLHQITINIFRANIAFNS